MSAFGVFESLTKLLLRIHHDGPVPCDWLLKRFARAQQEPDAVFSRFELQLVTIVKEQKRMILRFGRWSGIELFDSLGRHPREPDAFRLLEDVDEAVPPSRRKDHSAYSR
jgi:hypothetical protein